MYIYLLFKEVLERSGSKLSGVWYFLRGVVDLVPLSLNGLIFFKWARWKTKKRSAKKSQVQKRDLWKCRWKLKIKQRRRKNEKGSRKIKSLILIKVALNIKTKTPTDVLKVPPTLKAQFWYGKCHLYIKKARPWS